MGPPRFEPCVPIPLDPVVLQELISKSKDWALMHGACMRSKANFSEDALQFAPFVLFPSVFPRKEFEKATKIQTILNELVHKVAHNNDFLEDNLRSTIEVDEFTANLFNIYRQVREEGVTQQLWSLGLLRSDYLLHSSAASVIKQVEINTIASSFGGISSHLGTLHSYVFQELGLNDKQKNLPSNNALEGLCEAMLESWKYYGVDGAVIMFIVEDVTYNICDQRFHEFKIREMASDVKVIRRTLTEVGLRAKLGQKKELQIDGFEVAVVYFRSGYEPAQYHGPHEWGARLLIERSLAIKCPSIHYHLAGTKKVQQALANPGALEKFLDDPAKVEAVRGIFTGLYSLDFTEQGQQAVELALAKPESYVLKPQREGGGNNVYGAQVKEMLEHLEDSKERRAWILMERIRPPVQKSYIIRPRASNTQEPGLPEPVDVVSELGIFGVIIGSACCISLNRQVGHMLRTKVSTADEGGVAAGTGALDSPYLID